MAPDFIPYGRQSINSDDIAAVAAVLRSDWLTTGPAVDGFEQALSEVTTRPTVAVSSGTAALHCAYAAAGVEAGSEIITSPLTFVATAATAANLGANVRFADVEDDTLNLDPEAVMEILDERTAVIAPVDYAGHPADIPAIRKLADQVGAVVVEDASHALGASLDGAPVGSMAHLTTLSFHPVKTITTGEGGAIVAGDSSYVEPLRRFRNHGLVRSPEHFVHDGEGGWHQEVHSLGLNYRLPDILAALGASQLRRLPAFVARRAALVDRYRELLSDLEGIRLPSIRSGASPAWHLFAIRVLGGRRQEIYDRLRVHGIGTQVHYLPVHLQPLFLRQGFRQGMFPVAEKAYSELLSLPLYPDLTMQQQDRVVAGLRDAITGR